MEALERLEEEQRRAATNKLNLMKAQAQHRLQQRMEAIMHKYNRPDNSAIIDLNTMEVVDGPADDMANEYLGRPARYSVGSLLGTGREAVGNNLQDEDSDDENDDDVIDFGADEGELIDVKPFADDLRVLVEVNAALQSPKKRPLELATACYESPKKSPTRFVMSVSMGAQLSSKTKPNKPIQLSETQLQEHQLQLFPANADGEDSHDGSNDDATVIVSKKQGQCQCGKTFCFKCTK